MTGMGNLSLMVSLLRARKSGHMRQEPSFFKTMTTREEYGLVLGRMTPAVRSSWTIFSISFFCAKGGDMDVYLGEGFLGRGEWSDHGHCGKEGFLGEWKILFDV